MVLKQRINNSSYIVIAW